MKHPHHGRRALSAISPPKTPQGLLLNMSSVSTWLFIGFLCCASFHVDAAEVPIKEGMSFTSARNALIQNGWKPNPTDLEKIGVENIFIRKGFIEIESCTMGIQFCSFYYLKDQTCLGVATVGEEIKDMKIYSWNFECPERE
ncbi:hypothetical protein PHLH6_20100 [Pseudomonas sp. Seg1]|nr:hypothetical protein PHLH6_20100 [Pseudomonas sp. Seg1]